MMVKMNLVSIDYQHFTLWRSMVLSKQELDYLRFMTGDQIRATFSADQAMFDVTEKYEYLQ